MCPPEPGNLIIAPSLGLLRRHRDEFGIPEAKLAYLDYGFDRARLGGRVRAPGEPFTFGYIGTHIPAKGIHHLLAAFGQLPGDARLRIWGRPRGQETDALKALARRLPGGAGERVEWRGEYRNQAIVAEVFNRADAIVVPSIWAENSPLVIHEAQQVRVPVITADFGGMAEYVHHEFNGLLFTHRDPAALAVQMRRLLDDPALASRLGARGYAHSDSGDVPSIEEHTRELESIYERVLTRRDSARLQPLPGPWRITFDTNPDTCNLRCVMCEEHSPHSTRQVERRAAGKPRRVMSIELVRKVIAEAAARGLREVIPSTMGEPLLYEYFDEILDLCRAHGVKLNLTTNGTFPGRGARAWAERIVPVTSDVKISWNGATKRTQELVMPGSRWEKVLGNVKTLLDVRDTHAASGGNRCRVTFQLTFLESNVAELPDIVRLAAELGVDRVKGHHLWVHFAEVQPLSLRRSPEAIRRWNQTVLEARAAAAEHTSGYGQPILLENFFLLDDSAVDDLAPGGACPFLGREAWVSAEGRFDPYCAPDALRRTLGEFGSLRESGLAEIWEGEAYQGSDADLPQPRTLRRLHHAPARGGEMSGWDHVRVAACGTHHVRGDEPLYAARFDQVLAFHAPGLAPVCRCGEAWHVDVDGRAAYARRFEQAFGFYEGLAAVVSGDGWHHILGDGTDLYAERYGWCGNYQGERCAVRAIDGRYRHLAARGRPAYAEWWHYAGDFRDGAAVVQGADGCSTHIGPDGGILHGRWYLDVDAFHKGFARARDEEGWMHVDICGRPIYPRRFAMVEPFYNGQARVERMDGGLEVIVPDGRTLVVLRERRTP